jgi:hypothetical protein
LPLCLIHPLARGWAPSRRSSYFQLCGPWLSPNLERWIDDLISLEISIRRFDGYSDAALLIVAYLGCFTDGSAHRLI